MSSKFSLLANAIPSFTKHTTVEAKVDALADYQVQLLDYLRYAMSNLDAENFNATGLEEILEPVVVEIKNANGDITSIKATVEGVQSTVKGHSTTINSHTNTLNSHGTSISNLSSQITQTANKISAVVSAVDDSSGNVTAASIVAAINAAGSSVKISADHVSISGFVTFTDLSTEGKTTINAGNITTGSISANRISGGTLSGVVLESIGSRYWESVKIYDGMVDFYSGYIKDLDTGTLYMYANSYLNFETGGAIRFYMPNGRYFELSNGAFCYYTANGSLVSQAVFQ